MRLDTSQQMRTDMRLRMAPRMIQSMEILQLPLMALQERIDQELSENPILVDLREMPAQEQEADDPAPAKETDAGEEAAGEETSEFDMLPDDWRDSYAEGHRASRAAL